MDPMLGMIFMVPWSWAPYNYQLCQGQIVSLQQYEALYSLTGTVFGGNGSTTFGLPNLAGRAPIGTGTLPGITNFTLGGHGGSAATTLSLNNLPAHIHSASFGPVSGPQVVSIPATSGNLGVTASLPVSTAVPTAALQLANGQTGYLTNATSNNGPSNLLKGPYSTSAPAAGAQATLPVSASLTGTAGSGAATATINAVTGGTVTIGITGSNVPFSNMQPYLALSFVIAMNGLYPDRP